MERMDIDLTSYVPDTPDRLASGRVFGRMGELSGGRPLNKFNGICRMNTHANADQLTHHGEMLVPSEKLTPNCVMRAGSIPSTSLYSDINSVKFQDHDDCNYRSTITEYKDKHSENSECFHQCDSSRVNLDATRGKMIQSFKDSPQSCNYYGWQENDRENCQYVRGRNGNQVNLSSPLQPPPQGREAGIQFGAVPASEFLHGAAYSTQAPNHTFITSDACSNETYSSNAHAYTKNDQDKGKKDSYSFASPSKKFAAGNSHVRNDSHNGLQSRSGNTLMSVHSGISSRGTQRRLVRHGRISPRNTCKSVLSSEEKGKNIADSQLGNITTVVEVNFLGENAPEPAIIGTNRVKRDKAMHRNIESDGDTLDENEIFRRADAVGGWRTTRNSSANKLDNECGLKNPTRLCIDREVQTIAERQNTHTSNDIMPSFQHPESIAVGHSRNKRTTQASSSFQQGYAARNGRRQHAEKLTKRCRKSTIAVDLDVTSSTILNASHATSCSLGEVAESSQTRSGGHQLRAKPEIVIDIDELESCETGINAHRNMDHNTDSNPDTQARQIEADEELARQLQEQLYSESSEPATAEADATLAWTLQHENVRAAMFDSLVRIHDHGSRAHHIPSTRHGRASRSTRLQQLRRSFRSSFRTDAASSSSFRGVNFTFPPSMSLDMRLQLLEVLEAANSVTDLSRHFLHVQRDFNEDDYEMLLALDDLNHEHCGASCDQINALPESKVTNNLVEEACAVCLEMQSIGEAIRHLPCLHKFHKQCIDPWLRRRRSCPVCKSDVV